MAERDDIDISLQPGDGQAEAPRPQPAVPDWHEELSVGRPGGEWKLRIWWPALRRCIAAASRASHEVAAALVGWIRSGKAETLCWDAIALPDAPASAVEVRIGHEQWARIYSQIDSRSDNARIVGWFHSHPGTGIFLSERDRFIIRHFFSTSGMVSLVYDPRRRELGAFACVRGRPVRLEGFWLVGAEADPLPAPPPFRLALPGGLMGRLAVALRRLAGLK